MDAGPPGGHSPARHLPLSCRAFGPFGPFGPSPRTGQNRRIRVYRLVATASAGVFGTQSYVEREVAVTVSKCRATDGSAPGYECL